MSDIYYKGFCVFQVSNNIIMAGLILTSELATLQFVYLFTYDWIYTRKSNYFSNYVVVWISVKAVKYSNRTATTTTKARIFRIQSRHVDTPNTIICSIRKFVWRLAFVAPRHGHSNSLIKSCHTCGACLMLDNKSKLDEYHYLYLPLLPGAAMIKLN